jgi:hypothetical protein
MPQLPYLWCWRHLMVTMARPVIWDRNLFWRAAVCRGMRGEGLPPMPSQPFRGDLGARDADRMKRRAVVRALTRVGPPSPARQKAFDFRL